MSNPHRQFKDASYGILARLGLALASPKRLELLNLLEQAPKTVDNLAAEAQLSVANASQHLQVLKAAGLVTSNRTGLHVEYRLAHPRVQTLLGTLESLASELYADLRETTRQYYEGHQALEAIEASELRRKLRTGEVVLIDVRPPQEYAHGHINGAVNVPLDKLPAWSRQAPKDRPIVAYCRGPYCVLSIRAVELLKGKRRQVLRLADGVRDWGGRGYRIKTAAPAPQAPLAPLIPVPRGSR